MAFFISGCAGSLAQSGPTGDMKARSYESPRFFLLTPIGTVSITVTAGGAPNLPESPGKEWLNLFLASAAFAPLGLIAPPIYASALVVGGIMLTTGSAAGYGAERLTFNKVAGAVKQSDLPAALTQALRAGAMTLDGEHDVAAYATAAVAGWGLVGESGRSNDMHCIVAGVELTIIRPNKQVMTEQIKLTLLDPSKGAPPVQCASLSKFAEEDGRLVRETIRDYAEVLAVLLVDHLKRLV